MTLTLTDPADLGTGTGTDTGQGTDDSGQGTSDDWNTVKDSYIPDFHYVIGSEHDSFVFSDFGFNGPVSYYIEYVATQVN